MKAPQTFLRELAGALVAMTAFTAEAQQYTYVDPVTSRDSGLACVGGTPNDELNLDREPNRGAITKKGMLAGTYIQVFCPVTRRNIVPYGRAPDPSSDQVGINKVAVFVRSLSYSTLNPSTAVVSCRVYAFKTLTSEVLQTDRKYACTTPGGCSQPPSNPRVGWTSLVFDFPFGPDLHQGEGIVNIGYRCYLPDNRSGIIGSEALFKSSVR